MQAVVTGRAPIALEWNVARLCPVGYVQYIMPGVFSRLLPYEELWVLYGIHTRTRNYCKVCTTFIPVHGNCLISVPQCHNTRSTGTTLSYLLLVLYARATTPGTSVSSVRRLYRYPELFIVLHDVHTRTLNFCKVCTTFIPVPEPSVVPVRQCHNTRGTDTTLSYLPGTSVSFVRPLYRYPELL